MDAAELKKLAYAYQPYLVELRREFHRHPELSGKEQRTREILLREIEKMGVPYELLPGTGLIAAIKGGQPGKNKVLRADMDGLPVSEEAENLKQKKICVSEVPGVCHACGHDAHLAILLGTMQVLQQCRDQIAGTVYCCFEEGEETNCGVEAMLAALQDLAVEECCTLHVYNGLEAGKVNVVPGPRMAGTVGLDFYVKGKAGHGARPDQADNPIVPAAHIVTMLDSAFLNQLDAEETVTLGLCMFQAGEINNAFPEKAYLSGTARFFNRAEGQKALALIKNVAVHTAACHKCSIEFNPGTRIKLQPVVNDEKIAKRVQDGLNSLCGSAVLGDCKRWYASESYSRYLEKYPGVLIFLGITNESLGSGAPHHNGRFDVDESVLPLGVCAEVAFVLF